MGLELVIVILISVSIFWLFLYIIFALLYKSEIHGKQTITFREFCRISAVAPEKWKIRDGAYYRLLYHHNRDNSDDEYIEIYMKTYFDYIRLSHMCSKRNKQKLEYKLDKERANLIKSWQLDINNYYDVYTNQIKVYHKKGKIL